MATTADTDSPALPIASTLLTTPRRLVAFGVVVAVLVVGLGVLAGSTVSAVSDGYTVIGQRAAPQVQASSDLYFALSDLDAQAANVLLVGTTATLAGNRSAALNLYEQRRLQADHDLAQAAAGADPATQRIVRAAMDQLGHYESLVAQAVLVNQQGNDPVGRPSPAALALYRQATDAMRGVLAGAQQLVTRNHDLLDATYAAESGQATAGRVWIGVLGGLAVVALVGLQVLLRVWLRRTVNPALALATALALALTVGAIGVLSAAAGQLRVAKSEAFDSIVALSQARSVSYDANADESRFLVDPARADLYQQAFLAKSRSLVDLGSVGISDYDVAFAAALRDYDANHADIRFTGFLGTELRNITFPGERAAAERVLADYRAYQVDDRHLRALVRAGDLTGAITFDISTAPGDSDSAFNQYDKDLVALIAVNQNAFDAAVGAGQGALGSWNLVIPGLGVLLIVGLLVAGLWPRIAEYR